MPLLLEKEKNNSSSSAFLEGLRAFFGRFDYIQIAAMLALLCYGVAFIYGTGQQVGGYAADAFWQRQLIWIGIGFMVWLLLSFLDYRILGPASLVSYPIAIVLLVYVLLAGIVVFGARRWLDFGGIRLQPSELAKLAVLTSAAWLLSLPGADINKFRWMIGLGALLAIPFLLILKQPDLGSALVLVPIVASIAFVAKLKWRYIILAVCITLAAVPIAYECMHDYQRDRIKIFLDPDSDPQNRGWNQLQAEMAVGSGGLLGKGFMQGTQNSLGFLPQTVSNTDFIISVIAEETGFVGTIGLTSMYLLLIFSALRTALAAPDDFGRYLCVGAAAVFFTHSVINIGMSIRLMPVTGLPLPLVSYGGTFMVAMMSYLGIIQSVYARRNERSSN
jgi:rod shape determining protein RodA